MTRLGKRFAVAGVAIVAVGLIGLWGYDRRARATYEEQLRLARQEGMVTSASEFRARILPASDEENAAPFYRSLKGRLPSTVDFADLTKRIAYTRAANDIGLARKFLQEYRTVLNDLDVAVTKSRCWFDRHWEDGAATLMPELAQMIGAAKLVLLRATVSVVEGNSTAALADIDRVTTIAHHAGEEPTTISKLVEVRIHRMAMDALAAWSFTNRNEPEYAKKLHDSVALLPEPNLRGESLGSLFETLSMIDICSTAEGRRNLGLNESDISPLEGTMGLLLNPWKAKALVVEAERDRWRALAHPDRNLEANLSASTRKLNRGLLAFPTAAQMVEALGSGSDPILDRRDAHVTGVQRYSALAKALSQPKIPSRLDTSAWQSPFDGTPLRYEFDGKQIRIWVSGDPRDDEPVMLKVPPDSVFQKKP